MSLFELRTPRDMLEKARREQQRLSERLDIDNLFNFFVTAHHIADYIRKTGAVAQVAIDTFLQDQDIKDCRDLCDTGKHLNLTQRVDPITYVSSGSYGCGTYGTRVYGGGGTKWLLLTNVGEVDVGELAVRVLRKWEEFFTTHGL